MKHQFILWAVFTLCGLFAIVYKATQTAGSELTPFNTTKGYFAARPVTTLMHFLIAQLGYFIVISNPALLGRALADAPGTAGLQVAPLVIAAGLGLGSHQLADVMITQGQKIYKFFGNGAAAS